MASLPKATTTVSTTAVASAGGLDTVCVWAPVASNADGIPRLYGDVAAVIAQHGYSEGAEYCARHTAGTGKNILFCGLPIATPGVIGRENKSGNTGTCVTTIAAGGSGVLQEHDGILTVIKGGTTGTSSDLMLGLSLDGGVTTKRIKLGTALTYTLPLVGATVTFSNGGTLIAGETIHTWHGAGPRSDASGWALARAELAKRMKFFRSVQLIGDLQTDTEALAFAAELDAYETSNERFVQGRANVLDRLPQAAMSQDVKRMTGSPTLTFAEVGETGDTIVRSEGSWVADGFANGDTITVSGSASNNVTGVVTTVTASTLTLGATDLVNEGPKSGCAVTSAPTLTFAEVGTSGDTLTRSRGSWLSDGFRIGDKPVITGTASNNITAAAALTNVTATVLTFGTDDLAPEVIGASGVTVTAGQSKAVWAAAISDEFEAAMQQSSRLNLAGGRIVSTSPLSGWAFRIPAAWVVNIREYQHDLHIASWRKSDGPVNGSLEDVNGNPVEYDDRSDGAALSAAGFTSLRTWGNGPAGAFVSQDLTCAAEGSILKLENNAQVVNLVQTVVQTATEEFIGRSVILNDDGTMAGDAISQLESEVDAALQLAVLQDNAGEGPRASSAKWVCSKNDVLNVPEATVTGVCTLNLNGTIHSVTTVVRVLSGGQS